VSATDPYREWDAAYVLGSLTAVERREFESHLLSCDACSAGVAELAGLPGLLSKVPRADAEALLTMPSTDSRVPDTLLPRLVRSAARRRRANRGLIAGAVVAAAGAAAAIALVLPISLSPAPVTDPTASSSAPAYVTLSQVVPSPLSASVRLVSQKWGTRVEMNCHYGRPANPGGTGMWAGAVSYAMYVTDAQGNDERVATWTAKPGTDAEPSGTTSLSASEIHTIEVRVVGSGTVLLEGNP
jgi:hypothetical protein